MKIIPGNSRQKTAIRNKVYKAWKKVKKEDSDKFSTAIVERFYASDRFINAKTIAFYIPHKGEVNVRSAMEFSLYLGKKIVLPIIDKNDKLVFKEAKTMLFDIDYSKQFPEPLLKGKNVAASKIDLFIVPMVAYNNMGYRVGSGNGYYDIYFGNSKLHKDHSKVGFAFTIQHHEFRAEEHDEPLDEIYTERGVIKEDKEIVKEQEIPVLRFSDSSTSEYIESEHNKQNRDTSTISILLDQSKKAEELKTKEIKIQEIEEETLEEATQTLDIPVLGDDNEIDETTEASVDLQLEVVKKPKDKTPEETVEVAALDKKALKKKAKEEAKKLKEKKKKVKLAKKTNKNLETNEIVIGDDAKYLSDLAKKGKAKVIEDTKEVKVVDKKKKLREEKLKAAKAKRSRES